MSLLKKASIITTPTAYAEDYLYSIKPAYALGENLVTNGDFATDGNWSKGTGWTISGGKANGSSTTGDLYQENVIESGKYYKVTFTISNYVSGTVRVELPSNSAAGTERSANGTYTEILLSAGTTLLFDARTSFTGSIDNVIVQEITDADFDFDRNSTGTRVNEDYLIEDVPYNFTTYSEDLSQWLVGSGMTVTTNQIIAPDGTLSADKIEKTSQNYTYVRQSLNTGFISVFSVFVKKGNYRYIGIRNNDSGHSVFDFETKSFVTSKADHNLSFEESGNGWFRLIDKRTISTNTSAFRGVALTLANGTELHSDIPLNAFAYIWGGQFVKGDQPKDYLKTTDRLDIPRIDYTNGEPSILLEPSRTNSNTYSEDLSQWTAANGSVSTDLIVNPTGNTNKSYWIPDSSNAFHHIDNSSSVASGQQYTISIFLKVDGSDFLNFAILNTSTGNVNNNSGPIVNIKNGTKVGFFNTDYDVDIVSYGNGWHRYAWTVTTNATTLKLDVNPIPTSSVSSYNGNGSDGIYVYGLQVEAGSYATSLIHTSGSAVTRSADAANNAGNSDLFNDSEGVLYAEIQGLTNGTTGDLYISISDNSVSNSVALILHNTANRINFRVYDGGSLEVNISDLSTNQTQNMKVACKYKSGDYALWINGTESVTASSGSLPSGLTEISFNDGAGSNSFYGNVKSVMVFKEALTDLELEKLTGYNNHELYMNYYNRLSYLGLVEEYNVESDINNYIL